MKPKVSVIIPVYNVEKFLQSCINSLLKQTLREIEFIFVNDASPDNSMEILKYNQKKFPDKITIIDSKENLCQGGARNLGIKVAKGDYIGFVDSDDLIDPNMYELMYLKAQRTDADVVFCQCAEIKECEGLGENLIDYSQNRIPFIEWNPKLLKLEGKTISDSERMDLMAYSIGGIWSGLWKKELICKNNVFFPEHLRYEDNYWMTLIKCYVSKVSFVSQNLYLYRKNENSTVNSRNKMYHYDRIEIENKLLKELKNRNQYLKYYIAIEYIFTYRYVLNTCYTFLVKFDNPPTSKILELTRELGEEFPKWWKNKYYHELTSTKRKIINMLMVRFPKIVTKIYQLKGH